MEITKKNWNALYKLYIAQGTGADSRSVGRPRFSDFKGFLRYYGFLKTTTSGEEIINQALVDLVTQKKIPDVSNQQALESFQNTYRDKATKGASFGTALTDNDKNIRATQLLYTMPEAKRYTDNPSNINYTASNTQIRTSQFIDFLRENPSDKKSENIGRAEFVSGLMPHFSESNQLDLSSDSMDYVEELLMPADNTKLRREGKRLTGFKRFGIPTISAVATAGALTAVLAPLAVGGAGFLSFLVSDSIPLTVLATATTVVPLVAVGFGAYYGIKSFATRTYFKRKYGRSNSSNYDESVSYDRTPIYNLAQKFEQAMNKKQTGIAGWFRRRTNRNRLHEIVNFYETLDSASHPQLKNYLNRFLDSVIVNDRLASLRTNKKPFYADIVAKYDAKNQTGLKRVLGIFKRHPKTNLVRQMYQNRMRDALNSRFSNNASYARTTGTPRTTAAAAAPSPEVADSVYGETTYTYTPSATSYTPPVTSDYTDSRNPAVTPDNNSEQTTETHSTSSETTFPVYGDSSSNLFYDPSAEFTVVNETTSATTNPSINTDDAARTADTDTHASTSAPITAGVSSTDRKSRGDALITDKKARTHLNSALEQVDRAESLDTHATAETRNENTITRDRLLAAEFVRPLLQKAYSQYVTSANAEIKKAAEDVVSGISTASGITIKSGLFRKDYSSATAISDIQSARTTFGVNILTEDQYVEAFISAHPEILNRVQSYLSDSVDNPKTARKEIEKTVKSLITSDYTPNDIIDETKFTAEVTARTIVRNDLYEKKYSEIYSQIENEFKAKQQEEDLQNHTKNGNNVVAELPRKLNDGAFKHYPTLYAGIESEMPVERDGYIADTAILGRQQIMFETEIARLLTAYLKYGRRREHDMMSEPLIKASYEQFRNTMLHDNNFVANMEANNPNFNALNQTDKNDYLDKYILGEFGIDGYSKDGYSLFAENFVAYLVSTLNKDNALLTQGNTPITLNILLGKIEENLPAFREQCISYAKTQAENIYNGRIRAATLETIGGPLTPDLKKEEFLNEISTMVSKGELVSSDDINLAAAEYAETVNWSDFSRGTSMYISDFLDNNKRIRQIDVETSTDAGVNNGDVRPDVEPINPNPPVRPVEVIDYSPAYNAYLNGLGDSYKETPRYTIDQFVSAYRGSGVEDPMGFASSESTNEKNIRSAYDTYLSSLDNNSTATVKTWGDFETKYLAAINTSGVKFPDQYARNLARAENLTIAFAKYNEAFKGDATAAKTTTTFSTLYDNRSEEYKYLTITAFAERLVEEKVAADKYGKDLEAAKNAWFNHYRPMLGLAGLNNPTFDQLKELQGHDAYAFLIVSPEALLDSFRKDPLGCKTIDAYAQKIATAHDKLIKAAIKNANNAKNADAAKAITDAYNAYAKAIKTANSSYEPLVSLEKFKADYAKAKGKTKLTPAEYAEDIATKEIALNVAFSAYNGGLDDKDHPALNNIEKFTKAFKAKQKENPNLSADEFAGNLATAENLKKAFDIYQKAFKDDPKAIQNESEFARKFKNRTDKSIATITEFAQALVEEKNNSVRVQQEQAAAEAAFKDYKAAIEKVFGTETLTNKKFESFALHYGFYADIASLSAAFKDQNEIKDIAKFAQSKAKEHIKTIKVTIANDATNAAKEAYDNIYLKTLGDKYKSEPMYKSVDELITAYNKADKNTHKDISAFAKNMAKIEIAFKNEYNSYIAALDDSEAPTLTSWKSFYSKYKSDSKNTATNVETIKKFAEKCATNENLEKAYKIYADGFKGDDKAIKKDKFQEYYKTNKTGDETITAFANRLVKERKKIKKPEELDIKEVRRIYNEIRDKLGVISSALTDDDLKKIILNNNVNNTDINIVITQIVQKEKDQEEKKKQDEAKSKKAAIKDNLLKDAEENAESAYNAYIDNIITLLSHSGFSGFDADSLKTDKVISKIIFMSVDDLKAKYEAYVNRGGTMTISDFALDKASTKKDCHGELVVTAKKQSKQLTIRTFQTDTSTVKKLVVLLYHQKKTSSAGLNQTRDELIASALTHSELDLTEEILASSTVNIKTTTSTATGLLRKMLDAGIHSREEDNVTLIDASDAELALLEEISNATIQSI